MDKQFSHPLPGGNPALFVQENNHGEQQHEGHNPDVLCQADQAMQLNQWEEIHGWIKESSPAVVDHQNFTTHFAKFASMGHLSSLQSQSQ